MITMIPNWYSHVERPDTSYPDRPTYIDDQDDMYFGYDDFEDEYETVSEKEMDDIVEKYYKMGPPDEDYMNEVKAQWQK